MSIEDSTNENRVRVENEEKKREVLVSKKLGQFKALSEFLGEWFYKPDMEAVKICLATYAAHLYISDNPVWLFIIGPPGSGKTAIAIRAVSFLENTHSVDDLGVNSFLSGFGENNGILGRLTKNHGGNGFLLFPDFTVLLQKKQDVRDDIVGQMRRIYDGRFTKDVGNKEESIVWHGKVSCLAAVTPSLEDYWQLNRGLGERFMYLRWKSANPKIATIFAKKQVGKESFIHQRFEELVKTYTDIEAMEKVEIGAEEDLGLDYISCMVSQLRVAIKREKVGNRREVVDVDEPEMPTRISKTLTMIARASATLDHRKKIDMYDTLLARRVALDSIPRNRRKIMSHLLEDPNYEQTLTELKQKSRMSPLQFERTMEELLLLNALTVTEGVREKWATLTPDVVKGWEDCMIFTLDGVDKEVDVDIKIRKDLERG